MREYKTYQRSVLLDFFSKNTDKQFTVEEISGRLSDKMSKSALYRNIDKLVEAGKVKRCAKAGNRIFLYQYVDSGSCSEHLHLQCLRCGKIFHLNDTASVRVINAAKEDGFSVDIQQTVIFGTCSECQT